MAQRLIRLPWQQQPQEVVLRPSEQYADLHAGWLGSQPGVLVGAAGAAWSRVGSPIIEPSRAGLASRAASYSTAAYYTGPSISGASLAWPGITVVAVLPAFVSVGSDFPAAVCIAPTGELYGVGMLSFQISGYNTILWRVGDSGNYLSATAYNNTALSHEWAAGEDLVIVARWDKTTAKLAVSRNGSIMRNSASHSYGWRSGTNLMQIGGYVRSGNRMLVSPLAMAAVLPRDVGDRAESELLDNPWQIFEDQSIWVPVSATADVTVALSGSSVAANAGALTPSTSVAVSGSVSAASTGTLAPTASLALTGSSVTASSGTLTPSLSVTLSGQSVTSSAGTLTANTGSDVTVALSGAAVTVSAGTIAPSATVALSGSAVTSAVGTVSPGLSVALSGASSTSAAGTLTASTSQDVTVALTGSAVTVSAGTLTPSGGDTPAVNPGWGGGAVGGGGGKGLRELTARIAKDAEDLLERKRKAPNAQISQPAALEPAPAPTRKTSSRSAGSSESADRVAAEPAVPGSQAEVLSELRSLRGAVEKLEALILADREEARKRQEQDEEEAAVVKLLLN